MCVREAGKQGFAYCMHMKDETAEFYSKSYHCVCVRKRGEIFAAVVVAEKSK